MNWTEILKGIAPTLASAALGPLGGLAVSAIGSAIGIDSPTQDKIAKAFTQGQLTPEALEKIKLLELDYQNQEKERGFKYAELEFKGDELIAKDRADARDMQVATKSWVPSALALIITVGYLGILVGLMKGVLTVADNQVLLILIGALATGFGTVLNFFLGSSHGSQSKDSMLMNSTPAK